jgi:hypothetical protein
MGIALSTAGVTVGYAVESTAGTRPTTDYALIPDVRSTPDLNPEPQTLDVTTLAETEWMQYIPGLKDVGGSLAFGCLNTNAFQTAWASLVAAAETAAASDKATWFEIRVPGLTNSFYFAGSPTPLGLAAMEVNAAVEIDANITPSKVAGWATKSTAS